uniref:Galectin n=2 Tax=Meloidogyne TaxID=189290 RepID=A0A915P9L0_9BILA
MCQVLDVNVHVSSARRQRSFEVLGVNVHVSSARRQRSFEVLDVNVHVSRDVNVHLKFKMIDPTILRVETLKEIKSPGLYEFKCILSGAFADYGKELCAIICDVENSRADLFVSGENMKHLELLGRGDNLKIKKSFGVIEDKCIILKMNVEDLIVLEKKSEVCSILTTPVKKNDDNSKKEKK